MRPQEMVQEAAEDTKGSEASTGSRSGLHELATVKDFAQAMTDRRVYSWWRKGMGYTDRDDGIKTS